MLERAKNCRINKTNAENRFWYYVRNRRLKGYKFIREHMIGAYIVDFVCRAKKLIVEIDGGSHTEIIEIEHDQKRTEYLEKEGYKVIRFWNMEVFTNIEGVLETVLDALGDEPL